jgi:hypothetical protein
MAEQDNVPEPYTKMIENLNSNDLNMAEKYADLVIEDFPDSNYVFNAYLVKNMVVTSKLIFTNKKFNYIGNGIGHMGVLSSEKDIKQVEKYVKDLNTEIENIVPIFESTTRYVLNNFLDSEKVKLEMPKAPEGLTIPSDSDFHALSWFSQVGSPVPTDTEMSLNDSNNQLKAFYYINNGFSEKDFSFIDYFYTATKIIDNPELNKQLLNKVIGLTENDKYNESRIKAENDLKNMK